MIDWWRARRLPRPGRAYKRQKQRFVVLSVGTRNARVLYIANGTQGVVPLDDFLRRIAKRRRWA